jgi:hypothetical protein
MTFTRAMVEGFLLLTVLSAVVLLFKVIEEAYR